MLAIRSQVVALQGGGGRMICPKCGGKGYVYNALGSFNEDCGHCQGTGNVRVEGEPITNEEWFNTMNTEEKAFALETIIRSVLVLRSPMCHDVCNREFWERWLKEKHE